MKLFYRILIGFLVLFLILIYFFGIKYLQISCDAGYYLAIARDIANGNILFLDIFNVYAPLTFSYFSLFFRVNPNINYEFLVVGQIFLELTGGLAFFFLAKKLTDNTRVSIVSSLLFLIAEFYNEGYHIMLEPMVLVFMLWALVVLVYYPTRIGYLISGALVGMAFLSKQYAIIGTVVIGSYILLNEKEWKFKILYSFFAACAFLGIIGIYFGYKIYIQGIGSAAFFTQFFPSNIGHYDMNQNNFSNFISFVFSMQMLVYLAPLALVLVFENLKLLENKMLITIIIAHILFLAPLHVFQFIHYKILFLPYCFLLFAFLLNKVQKIKSISFVLSTGMIMIYLLMPIRGFSAFYHSGEKEAQYKLAAKLNEIIPDTAKVALYSNEEQYYLANLKSCDLKKYSYAFITYLSDDKIYEKADYVIFDRIHIPDTNRLREVYDIHFFKDVEKEVFIYKKSAN